MAVRDYVKPTWLNGSTRLNSTNLTAVTDKIDDLDKGGRAYDDFQQLKEYFYYNCVKDLCSSGTTPFVDSSSGFTVAPNVTVADSTADYAYNRGIKITEGDNSAGECWAYKAITSFDFTYFHSNMASDTGDFIYSVVYVSDVTKINNTTGNGIIFKFGSSSSNYYKYSFTGLTTGWNFLYAKKSDFTGVGSPPAWSAITWIQLSWISLANAINANVEFHCITLIKKDPLNSSFPFPLQIANSYTSDWERRCVPQFQKNWNVVYDNKNNYISILSKFASAPSIIELQMSRTKYKDFSVYSRQYVKTNSGHSVMSMTWYVDANNYIEFAVKDDVIILNICENGSVVAYSTGVFTSLALHTQVDLYLWKYGSKIWAKISTGNGYTDTQFITAVTGLITQSGHIYLGGTDVKQSGSCTDFQINQDPPA